MEREALVDLLKQKLELNDYVDLVLKDKTILPLLLEIIETDKTAIKFLCEKIIRKISEEHPEILYAFFERMAMLFDSENNFIRWGFMKTITNLIRVDEENKWTTIHEHYFSFLDSTSIVVFGNAVSGVSKILRKYPQYEKEILPKLLNIDQHTFLYQGEVSPECTNVAKGQIMDCFSEIYGTSQYKNEIRAFVLANIDNPRKKVGNIAKRLLREME